MLFNLQELKDKSANNDKESEVKVTKFLDLHCERVEGLRDLLGRLPGRDECMFLWTVNSFNAFTFIPYILKYAGRIDTMTVATYSINKRIVDALVRYMDGGHIGELNLLLSDRLKYRVPVVVDHLSHIASNRQGMLNVGYEWVHAKVSLIESCGEKYVVEGSGNWSENSRFEQYMFMNSEKVYDFRKSWIIDKIV